MAFNQGLDGIVGAIGQFAQYQTQKDAQAKLDEQAQTDRQRAFNQEALNIVERGRARGDDIRIEEAKAALNGEEMPLRADEMMDGPPVRRGLFDRRTEEYEQAQERKKIEQDRQDEMFGINKRVKESQINANRIKNKNDSQKATREGIDSLRKEISNLPATRDLTKIDAAYGKVEGAVKQKSAAGDLALVFNFMKMLDPGSTVREGEFANAAAAAGLGDRFIAAAKKIDSGEILTEDQRNDFLQAARNSAASQYKTYQRTIAPQLLAAEERGYESASILPSFQSERFLRPQQAQPQMAQQAPLPPGAQVAQIPGQPEVGAPVDPFQQAMDAAVSPAMAAPQVLSPEVLQQKMSRYQELLNKANGGR